MQRAPAASPRSWTTSSCRRFPRARRTTSRAARRVMDRRDAPERAVTRASYLAEKLRCRLLLAGVGCDSSEAGRRVAPRASPFPAASAATLCGHTDHSRIVLPAASHIRPSSPPDLLPHDRATLERNVDHGLTTSTRWTTLALKKQFLPRTHSRRVRYFFFEHDPRSLAGVIRPRRNQGNEWSPHELMRMSNRKC
jgi:hypothetical protein